MTSQITRRPTRVVALQRQAGDYRIMLATFEAKVKRGELPQSRVDAIVERIEECDAESKRIMDEWYSRYKKAN